MYLDDYDWWNDMNSDEQDMYMFEQKLYNERLAAKQKISARITEFCNKYCPYDDSITKCPKSCVMYQADLISNKM